jgi:hypothetical protein
MKGRHHSFLILAVLVWCLTYTLIHEPPVAVNGEKDAYFANVIYEAKVRAREDDTWIFTVYNINCEENDKGEARFFLKFYLDGDLWWDESEVTSYKNWLCNRGNNVTLSYKIRGWDVIQPRDLNAKIELYWLNQGKPQLEQAIYFDVSVAILVSLQHIHALSYLLAYLIACFLVLSYYYVSRLMLKEE